MSHQVNGRAASRSEVASDFAQPFAERGLLARSAFRVLACVCLPRPYRQSKGCFFIMPMQRHLYPANWDEIALSMKTAANWKCEFCGKPCRPPGISLAETEQWLSDNHPEWLPHLYATVEDNEHGTVEVTKPQRFTLTVAHMNHVPSDCDRSNLKALCSVCHCRYDAEHHKRSRIKNRMKKQEQDGQLTLEF